MAKALQNGELVALPTETVYGLAAHALNEKAARNIFSVKGRPLIDPLIVHVADLSMAKSLAQINELATKCAAAFWPGPLTLILPKLPCVPDVITAGLDTVAIRVPAHPVFQAILKTSNLPLAAPSANPFGYISPSKAEHVVSMLSDRLDHVVDGGPCTHGVESTILDLSTDTPTVLRPGPISPSELQTVLKLEVTSRTSHQNEQDQAPQKAAGQLLKHYSPRTPSSLHSTLKPELADPRSKDDAHLNKKCAFVFISRPSSELEKSIQSLGHEIFWLSESGDAQEVMKNLYDMLHRLDQKGFRALFFERAQESESFSAVRDRMFRACSQG
jgi:L-threonylcarbamoyladenylate synthase